MIQSFNTKQYLFLLKTFVLVSFVSFVGGIPTYSASIWPSNVFIRVCNWKLFECNWHLRVTTILHLKSFQLTNAYNCSSLSNPDRHKLWRHSHRLANSGDRRTLSRRVLKGHHANDSIRKPIGISLLR